MAIKDEIHAKSSELEARTKLKGVSFISGSDNFGPTGEVHPKAVPMAKLDKLTDRIRKEACYCFAIKNIHK